MQFFANKSERCYDLNSQYLIKLNIFLSNICVSIDFFAKKIYNSSVTSVPMHCNRVVFLRRFRQL